MKQFILKWAMAVLSIIATGLNSTAANMAADIVAKAVNRYQSVPSLNVDFTVSSPGNESVSGTIVSAGDRFRLDMPGMQTWYDGRTQWSYLQSTNEVNITEPTAEELAQINPFAMVSVINGAFNPTLISSGKQTQIVRFIPAHPAQSDIKSMVVTFDTSTSWPKKIEIDSQNGQITITVNNVKAGGKLPAATFVYNKKTHPGAEIVDLR